MTGVLLGERRERERKEGGRERRMEGKKGGRMARKKTDINKDNKKHKDRQAENWLCNVKHFYIINMLYVTVW